MKLPAPSLLRLLGPRVMAPSPMAYSRRLRALARSLALAEGSPDSF